MSKRCLGDFGPRAEDRANLPGAAAVGASTEWGGAQPPPSAGNSHENVHFAGASG